MPNTMRGQASALYLFVVNLIGLGLGPTIVATLTQDAFQDKNAVHLSLLVTGQTRPGGGRPHLLHQTTGLVHELPVRVAARSFDDRRGLGCVHGALLEVFGSAERSG